jgi:DNA-binding response OmpR family regulator
MRLLLVEDDLPLVSYLLPKLRSAGFVVDHAPDGIEAEFLGQETGYGVIVLDLGLPGRCGLEVLKNWREQGNQSPVIILSARHAWEQRVDGLKAGADDYLGKPFHVEELIARVNALTRRGAGRMGRYLEAGGLSLDEERQQVTLADGRAIALTGTEFRLLRYFMLHPQRVLSKDRLIAHVYEEDREAGGNLIEVYVRRLREKVGRDRILTQRGQGYLFVRRP